MNDHLFIMNAIVKKMVSSLDPCAETSEHVYFDDSKKLKHCIPWFSEHILLPSMTLADENAC